MSKVKAVIVVFLLVACAGGGAFYGLNLFYQKQIEEEALAHLAQAEEAALDSLRVDAFKMVQSLTRESGSKPLLEAMAKVPGMEGQTAEQIKATLAPINASLEPMVGELRAKLKIAQLDLISNEGVLVAGAPKSDFGTSLKGLPAVQECLAGTARDAMYELGGKLRRIGVVPVRNAGGAVSGCLMGSRDFDQMALAKLEKNTGLAVTLYLRKAPAVSGTLPGPVADELAKRIGGQNPISFGNPVGGAPILIDLTGKAYRARIAPVPGGTDPVHLAAVIDVGARFGALKEAQMMVIYATAALFVFGLILGLLLSGGGVSKEAARLRDSLQLMADSGNGYNLDEGSYSGIYRDMVQSIKKLASRGTPASPAYRPAETVSQILGSSEPPPSQEDSDSSSLDFESLLGADSAAPAQARPAPQPAPEPDMGFQPSSPAPAPRSAVREVPPAPAPAPSAPPSSAGSGPKVEMPGDLASFFDDDDGDEDHDSTREFDAVSQMPAEAVPPPAPPLAPPPAFTSTPAPMPPFGGQNESAPPMLDLGDDDYDDYDDDDDDQVSSSDYRPDATVIAQVPDELLKAATDGVAEPAAGRGSSRSVPPPPSALPSPPMSAPPVREIENPDEAHFKDVFTQFVQTKKQCGEPVAGLTEDKFVEKLRKNTADLKGKYSCKSVRFQVYVKSGKAALKATPIK